MNRTLLAAATALLFFSATSVRSQAPQLPGSTLTGLQSIQAANKAIIEKQQKTLETLDELKATADQLKAFGKRG